MQKSTDSLRLTAATKGRDLRKSNESSQIRAGAELQPVHVRRHARLVAACTATTPERARVKTRLQSNNAFELQRCTRSSQRHLRGTPRPYGKGSMVEPRSRPPMTRKRPASMATQQRQQLVATLPPDASARTSGSSLSAQSSQHRGEMPSGKPAASPNLVGQLSRQAQGEVGGRASVEESVEEQEPRRSRNTATPGSRTSVRASTASAHANTHKSTKTGHERPVGKSGKAGSMAKTRRGTQRAAAGQAYPSRPVREHRRSAEERRPISLLSDPFLAAVSLPVVSKVAPLRRATADADGDRRVSPQPEPVHSPQASATRRHLRPRPRAAHDG